MFPSTPPAVDLSRPRLKSLAVWIRDDLDLLVAREGPNVLQADDVLTLHETFVALRLAPDITALDLRSTGIHRAVQDVAGVATRWPSRLCDDCDKIIALWSALFGPLNELHPFLYERGGRLEGIANATEYSREALLKRWSKTCPEKLHPKRSHRLGHLGFQAGDWWINTLFAHHAGIIGLEAVEGGTTFDKHGAYAVVLKTSGEVEACTRGNFTYRCPYTDKGKFRLTAATPQSRDPIRVLRSHNISSIWGPRAGVRYEGLYQVTGWSIRQAKVKDCIHGGTKEGEMIFEVRFRRIDAVPVDEVVKRPTATEIDDYMEYKRLRKFYREGKRKAHEASTSFAQMVLQEAKHTSPIHPPPSVATNQPLELMPKESPSISRRSIFTIPRFDALEEHFHKRPEVVSPGTLPNADHFSLAQSTDTSCVILAQNELLSDDQQRGNNTSSKGDGNRIDTGIKSIASSTAAAVKTLPKIRDIIPWIDYEYGITVPSPAEDPPIMHNETSLQATKSSIKKKKKKKKKDQSNIVERNVHRHAKDSPPMTSRSDRRKSGDFKGMAGFLSPGGSLKGKDSRKSILTRSRNPMAKLFDGAASVDEEVDKCLDNTAYHPRQSSLHTLQTTPKQDRLKQRASSSDGAIRVHSPIPIRPFSPETPFPMARRGAIYTNENNDCHLMVPIAQSRYIEGPEYLASSHDDPFIETPSSRLCTSLPLSLNKLIPQPKTATALGSGPALTLSSNTYGEDVEGSDAAQRSLHTMDSLDIKIPFKNPFSGLPGAKKRTGRESSINIAPDVVV